MKTNKHLSILILLLLLAGLLSACGAFETNPGVTTASAQSETPAPDQSTAGTTQAEGRLVPSRTVALSFAGGGGLVAEVLVNEGQTVRAGDVLARLDGSEALVAQLASAEMERVLAEQSLSDLKRDAFLSAAQARSDVVTAQKAYDDARQGWSAPSNSDDRTAFESALVEYTDAEAAVRKAQDEIDRLSSRPADNPERQIAQERLERERERRAKAYANLMTYFGDEVDQSGTSQENKSGDRAELALAIARLEQARYNLEQRKSGPAAETLLAAETHLAQAQALKTAAEAALSDLELRAPFNGTLVEWNLKAGQFASPAAPAGLLADTTTWQVETTDLAEANVVGIQAGDPVTVIFDALPQERFTGQVTQVKALGEKHLGDWVYTVTVTLDKTDPRWKWNMTANVAIFLEK